MESVAKMKSHLSVMHMDDFTRHTLNSVEETAAFIHRSIRDLQGEGGGGGASPRRSTTDESYASSGSAETALDPVAEWREKR
ncbi:hypothetical protein HDU67_010273, partial [Dinochytrium kinnereticum]